MEKLKSSLAAKLIAIVFVIVSMALLVAGFAGMMVMDAAGGYQMSKEDMLQKGYEQASRNYSVAAMADYLEQYDADEKMMANFRYGIIKANNLDTVNLQNPDSYVVSNFDRISDVKKDLQVEEFDVGEDTYFDIGGNSIFDSYYSSHSAEYSDISYAIEGWLYDIPSKMFYVWTEDKLFPLEDVGNSTVLILEDGAIYDELPLRNLDMQTLMSIETTQNKTVYSWKEEAQILFYDDTDIDLNAIRIIDGQMDVLGNYGEIQKQSPDYFDGNAFYIRHKNKTDHYYVASYVNEPLAGAQSFAEGDLYRQVTLLVDFAYRMRYVGIVIAVVSLVVLLASFSFLMAAAGHRKGEKGIIPSFMDYIPLDVFTAVVFFAELAVLFVAVSGISTATGWERNGFSGVMSSVVMLFCTAVLAVLLAIAFCMSFAVRIKLGKWWRHTLIYVVCKKCMKILTNCLRACIYVVRSLLRSMTLLWKAWFILGGLSFLEFVALRIAWASNEIMVYWMLEKIIVYPVIIIALMQMHRLQKGARQIAGGQLDYQIDTRHMFWEIRKHGEYLNDIGHGINSAVNERMKSEHFKTELITNVSHDIKTPLTSIINYVDLLQKEEINNPTVQEYLEVLHRQSARLKKLIEDLMEASKASTGSLNVVMEKCDAGVMLVQTIGEFEEKLMSEQIELLIKKPDTDVFIEADNRHLWRVFDNLMNNICKYTQPSTRAYINLDQSSQQVMITFRNISRYQLNISSEELMERFVRGDSSRNTEGSGLGISIAKSLTELMNGTFELTVDGDLFKVILTFPLYGTVAKPKEHSNQNFINEKDAFEKPGKKDSHMLDGITSGIQNAGSYAAELGHGVADKTGQVVRRAGKYVHHVHKAIQEVRAEETARTDMEYEAYRAEKSRPDADAVRPIYADSEEESVHNKGTENML